MRNTLNIEKNSLDLLRYWAAVMVMLGHFLRFSNSGGGILKKYCGRLQTLCPVLLYHWR